MKRFLEAGRIVNTHGVRGEVKIQPWCDSAEFLQRFSLLYRGETPLRVLASRVHKGCLLALLEGVDTVEKAMGMKGAVLLFDREEADLPEGGYFLGDILGFAVWDERTGREIGTLSDVLNMPASDVYVIRGVTDVMLPAVPEFVMGIDRAAERITVRTIPGMLPDEEERRAD